MDGIGLPRTVLDASVALVGVGSLGSRVVALLIQMGIKRLALVDPDLVEDKDVVQGRFLARDIGAAKVVALEALTRDLGSPTEVVALQADGRMLGPGVLGDFDLVLSALDSLQVRLDLYSAVFAAGTPYLDLGVDGAEGRITEAIGGGACYGCHQDMAAWSASALGAHRLEGAGCRAQADPARRTVANPCVIQAVAAGGVGRALHVLAGRGESQELRLGWGTGVPIWRLYVLSARTRCPVCSGRGPARRGRDSAVRRVAFSAQVDSLGRIESGLCEVVGPGSLEVPAPWSAFGHRPPDELWNEIPASHLGVQFGGRLEFTPEFGGPVTVQLADDLTALSHRTAGRLGVGP